MPVSVPVPPIMPVSYHCKPTRAARPVEFSQRYRDKPHAYLYACTLFALLSPSPSPLPVVSSLAQQGNLRRLARNLALQLGRRDSLQVRAAADKVLVDVDVRDGALAVELFEVRLDLGYTVSASHVTTPDMTLPPLAVRCAYRYEVHTSARRRGGPCLVW